MNAQPTESGQAASSSDGQRGVRLTTLILLIIIALLFIWYVVADRLTPYTASALSPSGHRATRPTRQRALPGGALNWFYR